MGNTLTSHQEVAYRLRLGQVKMRLVIRTSIKQLGVTEEGEKHSAHASVISIHFMRLAISNVHLSQTLFICSLIIDRTFI